MGRPFGSTVARFLTHTAVIAVLATSGCGARSADHVAQPACDRASVPGIPTGTPRWLRVRISHTACGYGDPRPAKIAVTLNLRARGRVVDRVWMRGDFDCPNCGIGLGAKPWKGTMVGFTVDAATHHTLSYSLRG